MAGQAAAALYPVEHVVAPEDVAHLEGRRRCRELPWAQEVAGIEEPRLGQPVLLAARPGRKRQLVLPAEPLDRRRAERRPSLKIARLLVLGEAVLHELLSI